MSEYWVSQAKFYCKYCNVWIADNKPSRQNHDNSVKHKQLFDKFIKDKREQKLHGARSEQELKHQLSSIEKAAAAAIAIDRTTSSGLFYQNTLLSKPPPPPPSSSHINDDYLYAKPEDLYIPVQTLRADSSGRYEVAGQVYLEGNIHTHALKEGINCEIFLEHEDDWVPARIDKRKETHIPNTKLTLTTFDVMYMKKEAFTLKLYPNILENVKPDKLRLLAYDDGQIMIRGREEAKEYAEQKERSKRNIQSEELESSKIDGSTTVTTAASGSTSIKVDDGLGAFGAWQTVSVEIIDEAVIEQQKLIEEQQAEVNRSKEAIAKARSAEITQLNSTSDYNIISTIDPYNTGMYRGKYIGHTEVMEQELPSLSRGVQVAFKKRKRPDSNTFMEESTNIHKDIQDNLYINHEPTVISQSSLCSSSSPPSSSSSSSRMISHSEGTLRGIEHQQQQQQEVYSQEVNIIETKSDNIMTTMTPQDTGNINKISTNTLGNTVKSSFPISIKLKSSSTSLTSKQRQLRVRDFDNSED